MPEHPQNWGRFVCVPNTLPKPDPMARMFSGAGKCPKTRNEATTVVQVNGMASGLVCPPLVPSAPFTWWLELSHPPPCLSFPSQPLWGHQPPHFQASSSPPDIRGAASRCGRQVCSDEGSDRGKDKQLCPCPQAAATRESGAPMGGTVRDSAK